MGAWPGQSRRQWLRRVHGRGVTAEGLRGLFLTDGTAPPVKLIDDSRNDALPRRNQYAGFDLPAMAPNGDVYVWAESYEGIDGALLIPFRGSPTWQFYSPYTNVIAVSGNSCRRAVFEPSSLNFLAVSDGVYDASGYPVFERIVGGPDSGSAGDTLSGYEVSTVDLGRWGLRQINNHGDLAFLTTLTDGTNYYDAVFRADRILPVVTIEATDPAASEAGLDPGNFTFRRTGATTNPLTVKYAIAGTATSGWTTKPLGVMVEIPAGQDHVDVQLTPMADSSDEGPELVVLSLEEDCAYRIGMPAAATVTVADLAP